MKKEVIKALGGKPTIYEIREQDGVKFYYLERNNKYLAIKYRKDVSLEMLV